MDSPHSRQQALDTLADLFLTDIDPPQSPQGASDKGKSDSSAATGGRSGQPVIPKPIRFLPKTRPPNGVERPVVVAPKLRLTETDLDTDTALTKPPRIAGGPSGESLTPVACVAETCCVRAEAVFPGNLPGLAGAWLTQYANHLAGQYGTVGVVRVEDEWVDVELVSGRDESIGDPSVDWGSDEQEDCSLTDALHRLGHIVKVWLIRCPTPITPHSQALARKLGHWTLLCGTDEAAIVGAYRLLKQLGDRGQGRQHTDQHHDHQIGLMVLGGDEAQSRAASQKLDDTCSRFLGTHIQLVGWQKRMVPVNTQTLSRYVNDRGNMVNQVVMFLDHLQQEESQDSGVALQARATTGADPSIRATELPTAQFNVSARPDVPAHQNDRLADPPATPISSIPQFARQSIEGAGGAGDGECETQEAVDDLNSQGDLDLSQFLPRGGIVLQARCPYHRKVQLALAPNGQLHLLRGCSHRVLANDTDGESDMAWHLSVEMEAPPEAYPGDPPTALMDLIQTQAWVDEHVELLQLTKLPHRIDETAVPVLHLFVRDAKSAVVLAQRIGSLAKLHLLQRFGAGSSVKWYSTELN